MLRRARPAGLSARRTPAGMYAGCLIVLFMLGGSLQAAAAQEQRAEDLRERRQEKAEALHPSDTSFVERAAGFVQEKLEGASPGMIGGGGVQVLLGGLRTGAGPTAGLRYVLPFSSEDVYVAVDGLASLRKYWGVRGIAGYEHGRLAAYGFGRYRHLPEEDFYGIGPDVDDRHADYRLDEGEAGALVGLSPLPDLFFGGHASYLVTRVGPGADENLPDLFPAFDPGEVPGMTADLDYAVLGGWAEFDSRSFSPLRAFGSRYAPTQEVLRGLPLASSGGFLFSAEVLRHLQVAGEGFGFTRFNIESQQYIPFRRGYQGFAFREVVALTQADGDDEVPFYLLPALGGSRSIRGFDFDRFRGRHAVLVNAEYRWQVWILLDMALFLDAGRVFDAADDFSLSGWEAGYGVGFRVRPASGRVAARFDIARSREGFMYYLVIGSIL